MNLESLREHLAIKVMGWKLPKGDNFYTQGTGANFSTIHVDDWNPPENIEQAMGCIETFDNWSIQRLKGLNIISIADPLFKPAQIFDKLLLLAISLTCAKATGWKE